MAKFKKSKLSAKLGAAGKKAVDAHKADETEYVNIGDLPGGISNGKAQVTECKFDVFKQGDNTGEFFFMAMATVLEPAEFKGQKIKGLFTSIGPEPLCDTPGYKRETVDDHIAWVLNELRKMGAETEGVSVDDLEELAATIKEEAPIILFSTRAGKKTKEYPDPRIFHNWNGLAEDEEEESDEEESEEEDEEESEEESEDEESEEENSEEVDLAELGEAADGGDEDAQAKLEELALEADIDPSEIETWAEVAEKLSGSEEEEESEEEEAEDEEEEETIPPEKDEVYNYKPKGVRKAVSCTVTAVFAGKQTCNLKGDNGKIYKGVPWDELLDA